MECEEKDDHCEQCSGLSLKAVTLQRGVCMVSMSLHCLFPFFLASHRPKTCTLVYWQMWVWMVVCVYNIQRRPVCRSGETDRDDCDYSCCWIGTRVVSKLMSASSLLFADVFLFPEDCLLVLRPMDNRIELELFRIGFYKCQAHCCPVWLTWNLANLLGDIMIFWSEFRPPPDGVIPLVFLFFGK